MQRPFLDTPIPFGIAHQGGTDVAPGNTAAAFAHAVSLGYRYIETDVQVTSDGVLVVYHDADLEAGTGVAGTIESLTWDQVSELRLPGEHRLQRFDDVVKAYPTIRFNIEPKSDSAVAPLIEVIERYGLIDRVCIGSFKDRRVRAVRRALGPDLCASPGPLGVARSVMEALLFRRRSPYAALQIPTHLGPIPVINRWLVNRLHRLGLQVHVWTINDEPTMHALFDRGVDAIMSDEVAVLKAVLEARGVGGPGEASQ